eukprot:gnl/MRDRNA2_/MRDRNA2_88140_c0_seq1.p1 gnl/MRDRNA2_/MRDRNA2_88140_c0~~gnl/MRDRNA2_/MRDRNA2_88140_c0_seq1.p1  ORF type:complete len:266 (+),score=60.71 gnl/MRDRNA2_/MRDRNA2_88140_c0_seq1:145-942(+)
MLPPAVATTLQGAESPKHISFSKIGMDTRACTHPRDEIKIKEQPMQQLHSNPMQQYDREESDRRFQAMLANLESTMQDFSRRLIAACEVKQLSVEEEHQQIIAVFLSNIATPPLQTCIYPLDREEDADIDLIQIYEHCDWNANSCLVNDAGDSLAPAVSDANATTADDELVSRFLIQRAFALWHQGHNLQHVSECSKNSIERSGLDAVTAKSHSARLPSEGVNPLLKVSIERNGLDVVDSKSHLAQSRWADITDDDETWLKAMEL